MYAVTDTDSTKNILTPAPLMRIVSGFAATKALSAAVELGLFPYLSRVAKATITEIGKELDLAERAAGMLVTACAALELLEADGELFGNSAVAEEFLVPGKPYYFGDYVLLKGQWEYVSFQRLSDALRTGAPTTWDPKTQDSPFDGVSPELAAMFYSAMRSMSAYTAAALGRAVDFSTVRRMLDVGGGSGVYGIVLGGMNPHLFTTVYELPSVCHAVTQTAATAGMSDRVVPAPGDFRVDEQLPAGHDLVLLSAVLHNWNPETGASLLNKVYQALEPGGFVVICEQFVDSDRTGPVDGALLSLNMIVQTLGGCNYTKDEYRGWLAGAGFQDIGFVGFAAAGANGAMLGHKPK